MVRSSHDAIFGDGPSPGSTGASTPVADHERLPLVAGGTCRRSLRQATARGGWSAGIPAVSPLGEQRPTQATSAEQSHAGQAIVHTRKRRKRAMQFCGKEICGSTKAWPSPCKVCPDEPVHSDDLLCCACHRRPPETQGDKSLFHHFSNDEVVADAVEFWERIAGTDAAAQTVIVKGWVPSRECLCSAHDCFYYLYRKEKRQDKRVAARCVVCRQKPKSPLRKIGAKCRLMEELFRAKDAATNRSSGDNIKLSPDSRLCCRCIRTFSGEVESTLFKRGEDGKFTLEQYLLRLQTSDPLGTGPVAAVFHIAMQDVLEKIAAGRIVDLDDAVDIIRQARHREGLHDVLPRALSNDAAKVLDHVSSAVSGVRDLSFSGSDVNVDGRRKFRMLMPLDFDDWWIANIFARERELQREKSQREAALAHAAEERARREAEENRRQSGVSVPSTSNSCSSTNDREQRADDTPVDSQRLLKDSSSTNDHLIEAVISPKCFTRAV